MIFYFCTLFLFFVILIFFSHFFVSFLFYFLTIFSSFFPFLFLPFFFLFFAFLSFSSSLFSTLGYACELQQITINNAIDGVYSLQYGSYTTSPIPYNTSAENIKYIILSTILTIQDLKIYRYSNNNNIIYEIYFISNPGKLDLLLPVNINLFPKKSQDIYNVLYPTEGSVKTVSLVHGNVQALTGFVQISGNGIFTPLKIPINFNSDKLNTLIPNVINSTGSNLLDITPEIIVWNLEFGLEFGDISNLVVNTTFLVGLNPIASVKEVQKGYSYEIKKISTICINNIFSSNAFFNIKYNNQITNNILISTVSPTIIEKALLKLNDINNITITNLITTSTVLSFYVTFIDVEYNENNNNNDNDIGNLTSYINTFNSYISIVPPQCSNNLYSNITVNTISQGVSSAINGVIVLKNNNMNMNNIDYYVNSKVVSEMYNTDDNNDDNNNNLIYTESYNKNINKDNNINNKYQSQIISTNATKIEIENAFFKLGYGNSTVTKTSLGYNTYKFTIIFHEVTDSVNISTTFYNNRNDYYNDNNDLYKNNDNYVNNNYQNNNKLLIEFTKISNIKRGDAFYIYNNPYYLYNTYTKIYTSLLTSESTSTDYQKACGVLTSININNIVVHSIIRPNNGRNWYCEFLSLIEINTIAYIKVKKTTRHVINIVKIPISSTSTISTTTKNVNSSISGSDIDNNKGVFSVSQYSSQTIPQTQRVYLHGGR